MLASLPRHARQWLIVLACLPALVIWLAGCAIGTQLPATQPLAPSDAVVTFATTISYETALAEITDLGLRLESLCYEGAVNDGAHPTWYPMGQRDFFTESHTLVITTTILSARIGSPDYAPCQVFPMSRPRPLHPVPPSPAREQN
ncbi:MAG TPA: hypothetical protein VH599_00215 [Ktedonobacterales bacterium]|jgi:hypothetical protein